MKAMAERSAIIAKEARGTRKASIHSSVVSGVTAKSSGKGSSFRCAMRYGIAVGPVTMGVLPGERPMFDVWGKTVNLAARMEVRGVLGLRRKTILTKLWSLAMYGAL